MKRDLESLRLTLATLLEEDRTDEAVAQSQSLVQEFPDDGRINMYAGLALEQAGRIDEATLLLKTATVLAPTDPETFHNLAVCLFNQGDFLEAKTYAIEALKLNPADEKVRTIAEGTSTGKGSVPFEVENGDVEAAGKSMRTGLDDYRMVWNLGPAWTKIGFGLTAYCILSFAFIIFHPFMDAAHQVRRDPTAVIGFLLYVTSGIACLFWVLIDLIDRKDRFLWLIPIWVCGIVALPVFPLALYLAIGRKVVPLN